MKTILHLTSSIFGEQGVSSRLAEEFIARAPAARVIRRDLASDPVPHLDAERFAAFLARPEARTPAQAAAVGYSDALIAELKAADTIVLGLPMYNFGLPSQLKAYFDHVARAGVTFKYTEQGAVGLLTGKRAYVFAARGGRYQDTPRDTQTAYVRDFLAFLGITQVGFVYAEGLAMGEAAKTQSLAAARDVLRGLVLPERIAA
ncbi:MAG: NAD(P)H-dependent oxidoreductase [Betaproteobacteria bacterium]|nr:NAD(P)H-dependent oxidoreductase [Betaproteobacteria bacterium]MDH5210367.1 NAD(P)H-dependent oxidoreductase [Betaproteobacteria bacterium]